MSLGQQTCVGSKYHPYIHCLRESLAWYMYIIGPKSCILFENEKAVIVEIHKYDQY